MLAVQVLFVLCSVVCCVLLCVSAPSASMIKSSVAFSANSESTSVIAIVHALHRFGSGACFPSRTLTDRPVAVLGSSDRLRCAFLGAD